MEPEDWQRVKEIYAGALDRPRHRAAKRGSGDRTLSPANVKREWSLAGAWLHRQLARPVSALVTS